MWAMLASALLWAAHVFKAGALTDLPVPSWDVAQDLAQGVIYVLAEGINKRDDLFICLAW